jgi:hypothetical protein
VQGWGGGCITISRGEGEGGGGRKRDSLSRESKELKGASDVELRPYIFFGSENKLAGTDLWTPYNWCQLKRLYTAFDIENQLKPMEEKLTFFTGHLKNDLYPCCYRVHPEEVFLLFTLCRLASGVTQVHIVDTYFGGDKNRWTYAYPWMLKYLDERYSNIIGHQGLSRFLGDFPRFKRAIEEYVQSDHQRELVNGTMTIVPGINFLPWDVFAFINDSITAS